MKRKGAENAEYRRICKQWERTFFTVTPKEAAKRTKRLVAEALRRADFR